MNRLVKSKGVETARKNIISTWLVTKKNGYNAHAFAVPCYCRYNLYGREQSRSAWNYQHPFKNNELSFCMRSPSESRRRFVQALFVHLFLIILFYFTPLVPKQIVLGLQQSFGPRPRQPFSLERGKT